MTGYNIQLEKLCKILQLIVHKTDFTKLGLADNFTDDEPVPDWNSYLKKRYCGKRSLGANRSIILKNYMIYIIDFADAVLVPSEYKLAAVVCELFCFEKPYMDGYFGKYDAAMIAEKITAARNGESEERIIMNLCKSIDFLLDNAGPVIRYRLRKEILDDLIQSEEESLLKQIYQTPRYKELLTYIHPSGYIGMGAHSADRFKQSPLDDGEAAARLLSYYAIPKKKPVVTSFVAAICDDDVLRGEFTYYNADAVRFENRFRGMNSGATTMGYNDRSNQSHEPHYETK